MHCWAFATPITEKKQKHANAKTKKAGRALLQFT
jgi:hypothetical protein